MEKEFNLKEWIRKGNLDFLYRFRYPLLTVDLLFYTHKKYNNILGNHHKNIAFTSKSGEVSTYYFLDEIKKGEKISQNLLNKKYFSNHFKNSLFARKKLKIFVSSYAKIKNDLPTFSNANLYKCFKKYWEIYALLLAFFRSSRPECVDPFVNELERIMNKLEDINKKDLIKYLITPFSDDPIKKEIRDWIKVLEKKPHNNILIKHSEKYPWLFVNTYSEKQAIHYLKDRFKRDRKEIKNLKKSLAQFQIELKTAEEMRTEMFKDKNVKQLSEIILKQADERLYTKIDWGGLDYIVRDLFKIIADKANLDTYTLVNSYRYEDIFNLLIKNLKVSKNEIKARMKNYILISNELNPYFISGHKSSSLYKKINDYSKNKQISGVVGCKGNHIGKVLIIDTANVAKLNDQMRAFLNGNVLITGMTQPNIIPMMKKAGAIVTDQGGLTSHAAIISRELNIPCIVGTKVATQVFKDGDMVEVDAQKGTVKLIYNKRLIKK